ncbi:hypothetical protein [Saccharopolyspora rosea]|uniref:hypothetical protein n=1 Tax=Saccharopolyspora rosea TaxID=524884 RepID=UPI0021DA8693|nr:hypothetical protein [Saccharopolyspora rosea]
MSTVVVTLLVVVAGAAIGLVVGLVSPWMRVRETGREKALSGPGPLAGIGAAVAGLTWTAFHLFPQSLPFR